MKIGLRTLDSLSLEPLDHKGNSTSFSRGDVFEFAYKLNEDEEDWSYISASTEDDELDELAKVLCVRHGLTCQSEELAELLKKQRDEMQELELP